MLPRLLAVGALLLSVTACSPAAPAIRTPAPPRPGLPTSEPTQVAAGLLLVQQKGCGGCHVIPGVPGATGTLGPSLDGVAGRATIAGGTLPNNGPEDLQRWVLDPPSLKPGTVMPKLGLTDDQAASIAAYLETLT
jgi:cytochrome c1